MFRVWKKNPGGHEKPPHPKRIFESIGIKPVNFIIPAFLSFLAAVFDGFGKSLLIPITKGLISMDYGFIREYGFIKRVPVVKTIVRLLPPEWLASNVSIFTFLLGLAFTVTMLQYILAYLGSVVFAYQIRKLCNNMRMAIFSRYLSFGKAFFDKESFGHLDNVLVDFVNFAASKILWLNQITTEIFKLIIYFIMFCVISWKLTIFTALVYPILHLLSQWLVKKIRKTSGDLAGAKNKLKRKIYNILSNILLVKSYVREDFERKAFRKVNDENTGLEFSIDKKFLLIGPLQNAFMLTATILLMLAISFMVLKEKSGNIAVFLLYLYLLKSSAVSIGNISLFRSTLAEINGPIRNISEVFNDIGKSFVAEGNKIFTGLIDKIDFYRLDFSYVDGRQVLKEASFSVKKGEATALVGPSGSGKTTIISLLMRFYDCPPRSIFIDDTDIRDFTLKSLLPHMALVSQNTALFNDTLKNNIIYGLDNFSEEKLIDSLKRARLYDFVMQLPKGLETLIGDQGVQLSGGEKQRVSIARALLKNSEILILDEATSSLDTGTEKLIQEAVEEAIQGRTAIVIAHRLSTIKNSNKIIVVEEGGAVEEGTLRELLDKKGKFYQYWEDQKFY